MILTRAPLRISLGGGGTDLPSYYSRFGSTFVSASIDQYVYLAVHHNYGDHFIIKYSELETASKVSDIRHPLIRECLHHVGQTDPLEIVSFADVPAGTGLGSSGAFTVALLKAMYANVGRLHTTEHLAEAACAIEIEKLKEPVGKQDQFASAFGGINRFDIGTEGRVTVTPVAMSSSTRIDLEEHLCLFFTKQRRSASHVLRHQDEQSRRATSLHEASLESDAVLANLHQTKAVGLKSCLALERGELHEFGRLMSEQWEQKRARSPGATNEAIVHGYETGMKNGALGGKLIGAGGGGFLMFLADDRRALRKAMASIGYPELRVRFDWHGAQVMVRS